MLLRETLEAHDVRYVTTDPAISRQHAITDAAILPDCNKDRPLAAIKCAFAALGLVLKLRPDVVISTGAAPGFFCILFGRMIGARTLWIDSVANAERLSLCGRLSQRMAHECLTQWEHLACEPSLKYRGAVL